LLGPLAGQLGTRAGDLPSRYPPPPIPFGVIAGDRWINPLGALWLPAPHDGTVSVASTRLSGMSDHIVLPYTHTFIPYAEPVADQVEGFLRTGRFAPVAGSGLP
jgi:triacylglycerol lipase